MNKDLEKRIAEYEESVAQHNIDYEHWTETMKLCKVLIAGNKRLKDNAASELSQVKALASKYLDQTTLLKKQLSIFKSLMTWLRAWEHKTSDSDQYKDLEDGLGKELYVTHRVISDIFNKLKEMEQR